MQHLQKLRLVSPRQQCCSNNAQQLMCCRTSLSTGQLAGTVGGDLLKGVGVPEDKQPNMLLAVMWASLVG